MRNHRHRRRLFVCVLGLVGLVGLSVLLWACQGDNESTASPATKPVGPASNAEMKAADKPVTQPARESAGEATKAKATTKKSAVKVQAPAAPPKATKAAPKRPPKSSASRLVAWDAPIAWMDWETGLAKAKAESKPILLMVYADW